MTKAINVDPDARLHIKAWRERHGLSRLQVAARFGVTKTSVSNWELGLNEPRRDIYARMAEESKGQQKLWFLRRLGLSTGTSETVAGVEAKLAHSQMDSVEIKVFKSAGAGAFRLVDEIPDHVVTFPRRWLPTTQKLLGLVVSGDSMSPLIEDGFIVIVDRTRKAPETALGHIVAASDGSGVSIKYLAKVGGEFWLQPHNLNIENRPIMVGPGMKIIGVVVKWIGQPSGK